MRRKEREVTEFKEIADILSKCPTIRLGIQGKEFPYVVPLSFCHEIVDGKVVIWGHSAKQGLKTALLAENNAVCVEADDFYCIEKTDMGITTRYESIIGFGYYQAVETEKEKIRAFELMTKRYGYGDYPVGRCRGLAAANVFKIVLESITGKRNLPENK